MVIQQLDRTRVRIRKQIAASLLSQTVNTKAAQLVPANPPILDGVNDLTSLSYLNEPSILHDLQQRYSSDQVCVRIVLGAARHRMRQASLVATPSHSLIHNGCVRAR